MIRRWDVEAEVRPSFRAAADMAEGHLRLPPGNGDFRGPRGVIGPRVTVVQEHLPGPWRTLRVASGVLADGGPPAFLLERGGEAGVVTSSQLGSLESLVEDGPSYYVDSLKKVISEALRLGVSQSSLDSLVREAVVQSVMED